MNVAGSCLAPGVFLTPTLTVPVLHSLRSLHSLNFDEHGEKAVVRCLILEAVIIQQRVASRLWTAVAAAIAATVMRMLRLE